MTVKRHLNEKQRSQIKYLKKYHGKNLKDLSPIEKDDLIELMAKKLGFL